jgi:hypothetical protein
MPAVSHKTLLTELQMTISNTLTEIQLNVVEEWNLGEGV